MMRRPTFCLGAALLALACGGCDHAGRPVDQAHAAPAATTAASAATEQAAATTAPAPETPAAIVPTTPPPPAPPGAAPAAADQDQARRISIGEANALRLSGGAVIVDVRDAGSYAAGHVAGAINIPLDTVPQHLAELPRDKTIVTYCA